MFVLLRQLRLPVEAAAADIEATCGSDLAPPWDAGMREYSKESPTACGQDLPGRGGSGVRRLWSVPLLVSPSHLCLRYSSQIFVYVCLLCSQVHFLPKGLPDRCQDKMSIGLRGPMEVSVEGILAS